MSDIVTLKAYAKVNLSLDITGKRADGYHLLDSVMQSVSLFDTVTVEKASDGIVIDCPVCGDRSNIAYKASEMYLDAAGIASGVRITVDKHIPVCGGLGGGSADCATTLLALNGIFGAFTADKLANMAGSLGADVPFCMVGGTARCRGIGELIEPLPAIRGLYLVLISDGDKPSTGEMYRRIDGASALSHPDNGALSAEIARGDLRAASAHMLNVFESVWERTELDAKFALLRLHGAFHCGLSGSGPTVFGLFDSREAAENCAVSARKIYRLVNICHAVESGCEIIE